MELFIYIFLALIVIGGTMGIVYISFYNQMKNKIIRINEAESIIDEALRYRFDIVSRACKTIKKELNLNLQEFKEVNTMHKEGVSSFEFDRATSKCIEVIKQVKKDYPDLENNSDIKTIMTEIKSSEEKIETGKCFYNMHTTKLNKIISIFPSNIIARIHGITLRSYFDGKNLQDDIENDFKF